MISRAPLDFANGIKFYVPPKSTFHVGDVTDVHQYSSIHDVQFDLIVADPPWMSKSVKRKKTYEMNDEILNQLDLPSIATRDALIAFWLTNRSGLEQEMEQRFAEWGMQVIGNWKWLKLTTQGEPVYDFDNATHKVPFESLMFAVKKGEELSQKIEDKTKRKPKNEWNVF
uniref:Methyltransferase n=1 Tax=Caenorhabditis japonica TaxID=281687 RepID=A0A8R1E888_CAEJA